MKKLKLRIEELFSVIEDTNNFKFDDYAPVELTAPVIKVKDEYGEWVGVSHMVTKSDVIRELTFKSGKKSKTAIDHLYYNGQECVLASSLVVGNNFINVDGGLEIIVGIEDFGEARVYDMTVESDTHLYQTSNGLIHHNTSFARNYAKIVGLPIIIVEAPHITEEHIVNIPFMIIKGDQVKKDNAAMEIAKSEDGLQKFEVVQAESNLVTKIRNMKSSKLGERQHLMNIVKEQGLRDVWKSYRELINNVRSSYHCLLFLDEFYRVDNVKIRNMLRNILNGRIGNDKIPKGTFIFYASNMNDEGVSEIPMNHEFMKMVFEAPDKEQWFNYILTKYEDNTDKDHPSVKLQKPVFNKFYETFSTEDLNHGDEDSEVRNSPRRWEQLLLFINHNLPVSNVKEAKILMANVEVNFRNYLTGDTSNLFPKVKKMMIELVKETSGVDFDGSSHEADEWKDTMKQQISTKIEMDSDSKNGKEARKYVPVVSGEPGVGKCLRGNQEIVVDVDDDLYNKIIEIRKRNS